MAPAGWAAASHWLATSEELGTWTGMVPARACLLSYPHDGETEIPPASTVGLAAGRSLDDAALRAVLELAERQAVEAWWSGMMLQPCLLPCDLAEPVVDAYHAWNKARGHELRLLDLSSALAIPVIAAVGWNGDGRAVAMGFGAGTTVGDAARHAVGELSQFESNLALIEAQVARRGDAWLTPEARAFRAWSAHRSVEELPFLAGRGEGRPPEQPPLDLAAVSGRLWAAGIDMAVVDLTSSELEVPVARAIAPALWPGPRGSAAERLNPVPLPF
jgi:ribosomal protein S12 methylthiotransferase accessory factor YcaO